ncbi:MAG: 23S rRNA (adenine(2503)-C(2))-methyltransferase RlmN [Gemmatimonadetes bacterium]|nr:23S rRNA (adenine(2503)-C(2))-methyltransferase RlmN [Gemmatimonadota bacterium]
MTIPADSPTPLLGLEPEAARTALTEFFAERGERRYRADQVLEWVYPGAQTFDEMTNLTKASREALGRRFTLAPLVPEVVQRSNDGTVKHLWRCPDGEAIESVLIPADDRLTLCLSSQAGCALGCVFCGTGAYGFRRQLTAAEIVAQYRDSVRYAQAHGMGAITNIVFMGMGEPLANPEPVFAALTILNRGFRVGARHITVSTVGIVPGIRELARRPEQVRLAVSLHAPNHKLRLTLVPVEKRYPLPQLMDAIREWVRAKGKRVTFEYTMIQDVNDSPALADELAELVCEFHPLVNLIPMNPIPFVGWRPSPPEVIAQFRSRLERSGRVRARVRSPRGSDIAAACGQLYNQAYEKGLAATARAS